MRFVDLGLGMALFVGLGAVLSTSCGSGGTRRAIPLNGAGGTSGTSGTSGDAGDEPGGAGGTGGTGVPTGAGVGDDCGSDVSCRQGLDCVDASCQPGGSLGPGSPCTIQPECQAGLNCIGGTCGPAGDGEDGDGCTSDASCAEGLRCLVSGLNPHCVPQGMGDAGDPCTSTLDCYGGLVCSNQECGRPGPPTGWTGVTCDPPVDGAEVRAFFEVPGAPDADEGDFFRLPFPNDARATGPKLDLSGFPTPGPGVIGIDPVKLYVDALEANDGAWGAFGTTFFRFSGALDVESLRLDGSINWIDVTPGAAELGQSAGLFWYYSVGRTPYLCQNWLGIRRPAGEPMLAGHTYAVWVTTAVEADDAEQPTIRRAPNLIAALDDATPSDATLEAVHTAYAPFRAYLAAQGKDPSSVLTATVFTVAPLQRSMQDIAGAIEDLEPPTVTGDWVKCDTGVESPCPDHDGDRACGSGTAEYDEYHALVSLPIFQQGTEPYLTPADGGGIVVTSDPPREDVCLALTVPTGTAPAAGWPLVVSAHGTGGSFRSHVTASVAGALSSGSVKFAVLGIDQVVHGTRRGGSTESPDNLFFNFLNPAAARGNPLQGAADQLSLARFAVTLDGSGTTPVKVDPAKLFFFGHSQGSTEGSLMLPYADLYKAAVLSGNGASLMHALLSKTSPVDIKAVLPIVLQDPSLATPTGELNPVLDLLQTWIDPADPLNFARLVGTPPAGHTAKSTFMTYGLDDTFAPPVTLDNYAIAGRFLHVEPMLDDIGLNHGAPPVAGNLSMGMVTLGMRQYEAASGDDGHFVVFDVPQANEDMVRFFSTAADGAVPAIGD